ncbi:host cell division inhibitor Icd-like protein [Lelliottia wanjuensis]|uniref:host cell division inhibitor Icd-like protein n=1 Tax=Lelliottia wanjuensis TaxID=3050585 RepID=UPI00254EC955|nr:host cell division inhibitor Icd-like protein [Lelliottia sp. V106_16]MDK9356723.1 host cell division inhibitor Icd-like protein [Lelliottia sp. V106_16]
MAVIQHTETRPKFTWLFLGKPKGEEWTGALVTLRNEADTEEQAREQLSSWDLTFAAKIRTDCPVTCHWMDQENCTLWSLIGTDARPCLEKEGVFNHGKN